MLIKLGPLIISLGIPKRCKRFPSRQWALPTFRKVERMKFHGYASLKKAVMDDPDRKPVEQRERRWKQEL